MDRLTRSLAGTALGLLALTAGCKSVPEVPPGRKRVTVPPTSPIVADIPGVEFGNDPRPARTPGFADGAPGSNPQMGGGNKNTGVMPAGLDLDDAPGSGGSAAKSYKSSAFPGELSPDPLSNRPFTVPGSGGR